MPTVADLLRADPWFSLALLLAFAWIVAAIVLGRGMARLPHWEAEEASLGSVDAKGGGADELPSASLIVAARDEEASITPAMRSLLAVRGVREVIVVDDRSTDGTPRALAALADGDPRLRVVRVDALPPGWLGKTHALSLGAAEARGDWLIFTDADVVFAPDAVERALRLARASGADHIAGLLHIDRKTLRERVLIGTFWLHFHLGMRPWRAADPRSRAAVGIGGFNAVRRGAYDSVGGHRAVRLAVVDDMELARELKAHGFRTRVVVTGTAVRVRWYAGVRDMMRGLTKNFFAGADYRVGASVAAAASMLLTHLGPLALLAAPSAAVGPFTRVVAAVAYAAQVAAYRASGERWSVGVWSPAGAVLATIALLRSMSLTLVRGAVVWRDTRYPLTELRAFHRAALARRAALWRARRTHAGLATPGIDEEAVHPTADSPRGPVAKRAGDG